MKKHLTVFLLAILFIGLRSFAQDIVVTEIMFNDPSSGGTGDSLEFIEIYNNTIDPLDITDYQIAGAVTFTFPSFTLQPGSYQVIARNASAAGNFYGISGALQWATGLSLANNGGDVIIRNNAGVTLDSVRYSSNAPWPLSSAGNGSSVMLCDPALDNNSGVNWVASGILNANTYALVNGCPVYATPGTACNSVTPYLPVFAGIPYTQNFDTDWINGEGLRDVPDFSWKNNPPMGNNSFRRDDDGHSSAGWNTVTGAFTPSGANGTGHAARFHSSGSTVNAILDLYLDFSVPGMKKMKFWYINTSGNDSLALYVSLDNGATFTYLNKYTTAAAWTQYFVDLVSDVSPNALLRFKATGTAAAGGTDIGIDGVEVYLAAADDAGIVAITSPSEAMPSLTSDVKVTLKNYGSADLTSVTINLEIDGQLQPVIPWNGLLPQNTSEFDINLGSYTFPSSGNSTIKAWPSGPNGSVDGETANDTAYKSVFYQPYASIPYYEGFDNSWINKRDSNDVPGNYWVGNPLNGNSSWRRVDDGGSANWTNVNNGLYNPAGAESTAFSARFHSAAATNGVPGEMLLYVDCTPPGYKEVIFDYINFSGTDSLAVWMSEDGGNTFTFLRKLTTSAGWTQQRVQLGNTTSPNMVIRFRATKNGGGGQQSDIAIDEVRVDFTQPDAGIVSVLSPVSGCGLTTNETVQVRISNFGFIPVTNIPVSFVFNNNTFNEVALITLQPGETFDYTFTATADLSNAGTSSLKLFTSYPADFNPANDTVVRDIYNISQINTFPFLEDFETGSTTYMILQGADNAAAYVDTAIGLNNSNALRMTGGAVPGTWPAGSGASTTAAQAWTYTDHHATAATCEVDATSLNSPQLKISLRQLHITTGGPRYSFFRVLINDTVQVTSKLGIADFNPATPTADPYVMQVFDLSAYANSHFKVILQSACKYASGGNYGLGDDAFIDNFIIDEKPAQEIGVVAVTAPFSGCDLTTSEHITVSVINNGAQAAVDFPVSIKVDNGSWITETFTSNILPDSTATYTFNATFDLSAFGPHSVTFVTGLSGDPDQSNDTLYATVNNVPYITAYPYFQNFEGAFTGWSSGTINGNDIWELGTPVKTNLNYAFSGSHTWVTSLTNNYENNADIFVASPCFNFTSLVHPYLSVWLNFVSQNNVDAMILEASVNDSAWYKIPTDTLFYNNYSATLPVAPPKWSGASNGFIYCATGLESLAGKEKVRFRFRFISNGITVNEGFCIDDFNIKEATADVQCYGWVSPTAACSFSNAEFITMKVYNSGQLTLVDLPVGYSINNGASYVYDTIHTSIPPQTQYQYTFTQPADLSTGAPFSCILKAVLNNDPTPLNNFSYYTLDVLPSINSIPFTESFENSAVNYFAFNSGENASVDILPGVGMDASYGMEFTGNVAGTWPGGSSGNTTAAQAFSYADHVAAASTCDITASGVTGLWLKLALRQTHSTGPRYSFFRVMLNDTVQLTDTTGVADFNPATATGDVFTWRIFDITPYIANPFKITLQSSCKYNDANATGSNGDKAQVDSVQLIEPIVVGVPAINDNNYLITYPNPTTGAVRVDFGKMVESGFISLTDAVGKEILSRKALNTKGLNLDLSNIAPGTYTLKVVTGKEVMVQRIIKE